MANERKGVCIPRLRAVSMTLFHSDLLGNRKLRPCFWTPPAPFGAGSCPILPIVVLLRRWRRGQSEESLRSG